MRFRWWQPLAVGFLTLQAALGVELFTEMQARVEPEAPPYTFQVLGEPDGSAFEAYGILVRSPEGKEQMLDQFDSLLPAGSEADVLFVEDLDFDGYADLRLAKYVTGGANVPYLFWLFDPSTETFRAAPDYEVILSPQVDPAGKRVISRQRSSAIEYSTEVYQTAPGAPPRLVKKEVRKFRPDGTSTVTIFEPDASGQLQAVETQEMPAED